MDRLLAGLQPATEVANAAGKAPTGTSSLGHSSPAHVRNPVAPPRLGLAWLGLVGAGNLRCLPCFPEAEAGSAATLGRFGFGPVPTDAASFLLWEALEVAGGVGDGSPASLTGLRFAKGGPGAGSLGMRMR